MPTAARKRKRAGDADNANNNVGSSSGNNNQLPEQPTYEALNNASSNTLQNPSLGSESPKDGAPNPVAPSADYTSQRRITRRLPDEPEHLLNSRDISAVDLSWDAREEGEDINPRTGERWLYPKRKKAKGQGSNLDDFREEIEERTRNGQGCKAIAEILIEKGVDTSARAVSGQRTKWGLRQRAPRRMTEQGIANIRKAHLEQAKRIANSDPVPGKRDRIRVMRKAEILRMTKEGMTTAQIAENLQARGVELKGGARTVERLRTIWGLLPESQRNIENIRQTFRGQALKLQKEQFENIATELGIQDVKAWVKSKLGEESALEARREHAYRLMGPLRPKPVEPKTMMAIMKHWRATKARNEARQDSAGSEGIDDPNEQPASAQPDTPSGPGVAYDPIELSDDDLNLDSEEDADCEGDDDEDAPAEDIKPQLPPPDVKADPSESRPSEASSANVSNHLPLQPTKTEPDNAFYNSQRNLAALPQPPISNGTTDPNLPGGLIYPEYWTGTNMQERHFGPNGLGQHQPAQPAPAEGQRPPAQHSDVSPVGPAPFEPPSQGWVEPRTMGPSTSERRVAPKPSAPSGRIARPSMPSLPPVITPPGEAEMMAKYDLYPFATFRRPPQKYLTPSGLVTTEGYEYLPSAPGLPGMPGSMPDSLAGGGASAQQQDAPQSSTAPHLPPNTHQLPPDVIVVSAPAPQNLSNVPSPPVVIPPEEAEGHRASHAAIEKHYKTAFESALECMEYLAARADARPLRESLTGLPPSLTDVELAKGRLRKAAEAMLAGL